MPSFWQKIRADFPVTKSCIYLDHASGGPIPKPVLEKIPQYYEEHCREADFAWMRWMRRCEELREKAARFINAEPEEIAFVSNTSHAMNLIAELLAPEGKVLTNTSEFPSSTLPWLWRKAQMVWQEPENFSLPVANLKRLLKPSVKTILASFVQYSSGFRQDLEKIGKIKAGRYFVVNATQGFGALQVDVRKWDADFLCTNSYKWMLAGYGGGILYIKKKWLTKFRPSSVSWRSMKSPEAMDNRKLDLKPEASRYEMGSPPFPSIFAVGAAIEYLSQIGAAKIEKRVLELSAFTASLLTKNGFEVISPQEEKMRSGITVFKLEDAAAVQRRLLGHKIYVSARGAGIRVAPHFYNSFEEIEIFVKKLVSISRR